MNQMLLDFISRHKRHAWTSDYDKITILLQLRFQLSQTLTNSTLDPVSRNSIADFFTNGNSDAKMRLLRLLNHINNKLLVGTWLALSEDFLKFRFLFDAVWFSHKTSPYSCLADKFKKKTTDGPVAYADNTFLPLRRLRANTLRPLAVLIRLRKPCTRWRWRFFGWNVLFVVINLAPPNWLCLLFSYLRNNWRQ